MIFGPFAPPRRHLLVYYHSLTRLSAASDHMSLRCFLFRFASPPLPLDVRLCCLPLPVPLIRHMCGTKRGANDVSLDPHGSHPLSRTRSMLTCRWVARCNTERRRRGAREEETWKGDELTKEEDLVGNTNRVSGPMWKIKHRLRQCLSETEKRRTEARCAMRGHEGDPSHRH